MIRNGLAAAFAIALVQAPGPAPALDLASHRALYDMTLAAATRDSGIVAVQGEMAIEWLESCQGWTFEHQSVMEVLSATRQPLRLTTSASTWESRDGLRFRFNLRHRTDGRESERIEGSARLRAPGGPGLVRFTAPARREIPLPRGTLFPLAHSRLVIEKAMAARPPVFVSRVVFDGMGDDGPFQVSAVVGAAPPGAPPPPAAPLAGQRSWQLHLAYFPVGSRAAAPRQEVAMRLYANGVADELLIDFDSFSVRARLKKLEIVDRPACD